MKWRPSRETIRVAAFFAVGILIGSLAGLKGFQLIYAAGEDPGASPTWLNVTNLNVFSDWYADSSKLSWQEPASYIVFKSGSTIYTKNASTGKIDYSGTNATAVIQATLNALTSGRTWKEKVLLKDDFNFLAAVHLQNYTTIEVEGKISKGANTRLFQNANQTTGNHDIEIIGGVFDGVKDTYTGDHDLIYFKRVYDSRILQGKFINNHRSAGVDTYAINIVESGNVDIGMCKFQGNDYFDINVDSHAQFGSVYRYGGTIFNCESYDSYGFLRGQATVNFLVDWLIINNVVNGGEGGIVNIQKDVGAVGDFYFWNNYFDEGTYQIYAKGANHFIIQNNKLEQASQHCIWLDEVEKTNIITGNVIADAGHQTDNTYDGIYVSSVTNETALDRAYESLKISGNVVRVKHVQQYGTDYRTRYGLNIAPALDNLWLENNYFEGASGAWNFTAGANPHIKGNVLGTIASDVVTYKLTENSGTAAVANGDWFAHGLAGTPTSVSLTPFLWNMTAYRLDWNGTHIQVGLYYTTNGVNVTSAKDVSFFAEYTP